MLWPKKIHTRNLITKKNSCGSKIPPPPITFLMVRPLKRYLLKIQQNQQECVFTFLYQSIAKLKEEIQQVFVVRPLVFVSNCCLLVFLKIFVFVF